MKGSGPCCVKGPIVCVNSLRVLHAKGLFLACDRGPLRQEAC